MKYVLTTILILGIILECVLITRLKEAAVPAFPADSSPRTVTPVSKRSDPLAQLASRAPATEAWLTITVKPNPYGNFNGPVHLPDLATMKRQFRYFDGPELAQAKALDLRMKATLRYGVLLARLDLTIPQREAMITQLTRFMNLDDDVRKSMETLPAYRTTPREQERLYRDAMSRGKNEVTTAIAQLVGEAGLTRFLDYEAHLDRQTTATALDQAVRASAGRPIAPETLAKIADILAADPVEPHGAYRPVTDETVGQMRYGGLRLKDLTWERIAVSSQGELNSGYAPSEKVVREIETAGWLQPDEVPAWHALVEQRQAQQAMFTLMNRR